MESQGGDGKGRRTGASGGKAARSVVLFKYYFYKLLKPGKIIR